jgi:hypothetical protein
MRLGVAFQQGDGDLEVGQEEGRRAADRAGSDDDDGLSGWGLLGAHCDASFSPAKTGKTDQFCDEVSTVTVRSPR